MRNPPYLGTFKLPSSSWKALREPWAEVAAPRPQNCPCFHFHLTFSLPPPSPNSVCFAVQRGAHLCAVLAWGPPRPSQAPRVSGLGCECLSEHCLFMGLELHSCLLLYNHVSTPQGGQLVPI